MVHSSIPLDDEEELQSLVIETQFEENPASNVTKRTGIMQSLEMEALPDSSHDVTSTNTSSSSSSPPSLKKYLCSYPSLLFYMFLIVGGYIYTLDNDVEKIESAIEPVEETLDSTTNTIHYKPSHHGTTFGGINNIAHPGGAKAAANGEGIAYSDIVIPTSNLGHAVPSLNVENIINHWGHYVHDEHRSPYASHLYDRPKEELEAEQKKFEEMMAKVREEWGAWDFTDEKPYRPVADFSKVEYRDLSNDEFPEGCWQTDKDYVTKFLTEARALVTRVREGIYAEYGYPLKKADGTELTEDEKKAREETWKLHIQELGERRPAKGIAFLSKVAFDGLVRKLLHAMITHDDFYAVVAGHSAAAGHGNDFHQNKIMQFQHLMEPVMDKLGVRLVSRNTGMGGVGTLQFSLAGKDIYGEMDFVQWDSSMTEKGNSVDFWNKQAILAGGRIPVILSPFHFEVMKETNNTAWMGDLLLDNSLFPETTEANEQSIPYAARWMPEVQGPHKFNAICWEPRKDVTPTTQQKAAPGSQVGWHPGNRAHRFEGRKFALIILEALTAAFDLWEESIATPDGFPLAEEHWHVGPAYETIRENLRTHINTDTNQPSACEQFIPWTSRICRVAMHGRGMWQPQAYFDHNLLHFIKPAPNGYRPFYSNKIFYTGFDLMPYAQKIEDGQVDVHAIAIATTKPPPDLDHNWIEDEDEDEEQGDESSEPPTRRWLTEATKRAFHQEPNVINQPDRRYKVRSLSTASHSLSKRQLEDPDAIIPGKGWAPEAWKDVEGFCDGSAQSTCGRVESNDCLIYGTNDNHYGVMGNSLSGWIVFTVPKVKEGIIMVRMEWWPWGFGGRCTRTEGWTEVNDGKTTATTPWEGDEVAEAEELIVETESEQEGGQRQLGPVPDDVPSDFEMDYAVNGVIKTMKREEWMTHIVEYVKNVAVWPILNDEEMATRDWDGEDMEVAIRFRSKENPQYPINFSHVFYA